MTIGGAVTRFGDDSRLNYVTFSLIHLLLTFQSLNLMNESKTRGTSAASPPPPPLGSGSQEADPASDKNPEDDDAVGIHIIHKLNCY